MHISQNYLQPVFHLFFPNLCHGCGQELLGNEKTICATCLAFIPKTKFHLLINNPFEQKMAGRIRIENATAMYYFNKGGAIQNLLHALKYKGKKEVGLLLGKQFGRQIEDVRWIADIDQIIPVPLSKQKHKQRGFNQSECIAIGIADMLHKPMDNTTLVRIKNTTSQTRKTRSERMSNVAEAFVINGQPINGKHILLVDDVVTTGATLEACAHTILQAPDTKVSLACLAYAAE